VILLFGKRYGAGSRGGFSIINIEDNHIKMPFDELDDDKGDLGIEAPVKITTLKPTGRLCFIYRNYGEVEREVEGGEIGTYVPYFVYPVDDYCKFNKALTKKYNQEHYIFAGYKSSETISIFYPKNGGKPRILKK
jgi:hypothetical protein